YDPAAPRLRQLLSASGDEGATMEAPGAPDPAQRPLIGALRRAPPRWKLDARGVAVLDREASRQSDRYGALDPSALYQSLKRLFKQAARRAEALATQASGAGEKPPTEIEAAALQRATTHGLRHFFPTNAAADGVLPVALMGAMGHADLRTTSIYTRAEERLIVSEFAKVRRRG
ncbi:site-specific integrase, partial [Caldimonas tepidiphila]|uniref:site-specific integrase n=1 Tax=Caldimonas tepidiphila TaxID=2315841 RepID=UPI0013005B29